MFIFVFSIEIFFQMKNQLTYFRFDEIKSTNTWLYDKMSAGEDVAGTVVTAAHQTEGRGMDKNRWESAAGMNLLFSIALNVNFLEAENQFKISQAVSVAIVETLSQFVDGLKLFVKWPNDIYFGDKKLAGMLIQNTVEGRMMGTTIIGVGLNVNQVEFSKEIPNPISLKMISGHDYDLEKLSDLLVSNIKASVESLVSEDNMAIINEKYISRSYRFGLWADYVYQNKVKTLKIDGFDKYGRLLLHDKEGACIVCDIKELQFFPPSY